MKTTTGKRGIPLLLAGLAALTSCAGPGAEGPAPAPTSEQTQAGGPIPTPTPASTQEVSWDFPVDDTHDAFEVSTGGRLGAVLVTVESRQREGTADGEWDWLFPLEMEFNVWSGEDPAHPIQTMVKPLEDGAFGVCDVVDANFDGYLDFGYRYFQGNQPSYWYYWIWDEAQGLFREEPAFSVDETGEAVGGICMPAFDPETKTVSGYARYGMAGAAGEKSFFRWEDGGLVCVRRVTADMAEGTNDAITLTVRDRTDGGLTEVFRREYPLSGGELDREREKWYDLKYHGE